MSTYPTQFYLKIQQVEQVCGFELTWGEQGQRITRLLKLPHSLNRLYDEWQRYYLSFYRQMPVPETRSSSEPDGMRGRAVSSGTIQPPVTDLQGQLVEAEARLLYEFHRWLHDAELFDIRAKLAAASRQAEASDHSVVEVFLTCSSLKLTRLPWETWEIGAEFATTSNVRIVQMPDNIHEPVSVRSTKRKTRVLAIVGSDPSLNFETDKQAIQSLRRIVEVQFVFLEPDEAVAEFKTRISKAIADDQGWDVLLFTGHSNETQMTGGELGIAPGESIHIRDITPQLRQAKERGLQFALFNSCSGLSIAESLVGLGLSQVAVMREPIHQQVAQEFLIQFLQGLAEYKDVHESLIATCQFLELEKRLTYPSVHLVPSLFRHPKSENFRIPQVRLVDRIKRFLPNRYEAIALALLLILGIPLPVQKWLIEQRVAAQAVYRHLTGQIPNAAPPLLLVQIDDVSLRDVGAPYPMMDRGYLARLINQAVNMDRQTIALDYVFDRPGDQPDKDQALTQAFESAAQQDMQIILGVSQNDQKQWLEPQPEFSQAAREWQGNIRIWADGRYLTIPPRREDGEKRLPFAYLLALAHALNTNTQDQSDRETSLNQIAEQYLSPDRFQVSHLTLLSYKLNQVWLYPIVDYSIPPQTIYERIPAWQFLETDPEKLQQDYDQNIIVIMPGGYSSAGINKPGEDNFPAPSAVKYWRNQRELGDDRRLIPGGEIHAYLFHHFLTQRMVIPIPDLWIVLLAAIAAKSLTKILKQRSPSPSERARWIALSGGTIGYGWVSLQAYISAGIVLPFLLPIATIWVYLLPNLLRSLTQK